MRDDGTNSNQQHGTNDSQRISDLFFLQFIDLPWLRVPRFYNTKAMPVKGFGRFENDI